MPDDQIVELGVEQHDKKVAEGQLVNILAGSGHLVSEQISTAASILQANPDLRQRMYRHLRLQLNRSVIVPSDFLTKEEQDDTTTRQTDKVRLAYERFGRMMGDQLRLLQENGQYTVEEIAAFKENVIQKLSWGGDIETVNVVAGVSAMNLPEATVDTILARHLADRALDRAAFNLTADEDVRLVQQKLGDRFVGSLKGAINSIVQERSTPQYRNNNLYREGESPIGNLLRDFDRVSPRLGLAAEDIEEIKASASSADAPQAQ